MPIPTHTHATQSYVPPLSLPKVRRSSSWSRGHSLRFHVDRPISSSDGPVPPPLPIMLNPTIWYLLLSIKILLPSIYLTTSPSSAWLPSYGLEHDG
ncbi:hypothetical protein PG989_006051 [Apiospora arundinis]|uniref:Uncharacterized protein n=1 Tax=Apiospora arundinis TaxID=335852 RepID=A0ABR2IV02_9PEZI